MSRIAPKPMPDFKKWLGRKSHGMESEHRHRKSLRRTRLRPRSKAKSVFHGHYVCALLFLMSLNPMCRRCNRRRATEGHHPMQQRGWLILLFFPVCRLCHTEIEERKSIAREEGWIWY